MKIFVINWKMNLTTQDAVEFCHTHKKDLESTTSKIILCPPATALGLMGQELRKTEAAIGAQSCSVHAEGDFTGQLAAINYAQVGASYVLIGHSEERKAFKLKPRDIALKALATINAGLIPLICISESHLDKKKRPSEETLEPDLQAIEEALEGKPAYIVYQALWTEKVKPTEKDISSIFAFLKYRMRGYAFLYEGVIPGDDFHKYALISGLCGFLVTETSTDFQMFKKVVSYRE